MSEQYEWFEKELKELEEIGGVAVIIGHHNPSALTQQFGVRFRALMERYQHVVRLIAKAHDHRLFYTVL